MNKVFLIGRLVRDPELRYTGSNIAVATFSLAVNRNFTGPNGEREADFLNIVVWRKQAENVKNYLKQGSQVAIDGRIQTRTYDDQNGTKRYITEIVADNVQFLDTKSSREQSIPNSTINDSPYNYSSELNNNFGGQPTYQNQNTNSVNVDNDPFKDFGEEIKIEDDDLPF